MEATVAVDVTGMRAGCRLPLICTEQALSLFVMSMLNLLPNTLEH